MTTPSWIKHLAPGADILIVHHWDTDGNCSAAMIREFLYEKGEFNVSYTSADAGTFRLRFRSDDKEGNIDLPPGDFSLIFILDYSVPARDIINFNEKMNVPLVVYDHHLRHPVEHDGVYYYNPVAYGEDGSKWPSCTWVIKNYLEQPVSDLAIMGIAGDYEERFLKEGFVKFPEIRNYIEESGADYMDYVRAKDLIDIHYKENDKDLLKILPDEILKLEGSPEKILLRNDWSAKQDGHAVELDLMLNRDPDISFGNEIEIYLMDTHKNIISTMTRRLAARTSFKYVMVVNKGLFPAQAQIYVRASDDLKEADTSFYKEAAGDLGAQVGGKAEVAGIIIDSDKVDEFIQTVQNTYG